MVFLPVSAMLAGVGYKIFEFWHDNDKTTIYIYILFTVWINFVWTFNSIILKHDNRNFGSVPPKDMQTPPPLSSLLIRFLWMMRNALNRKGKIIKKFSDFYFSSYDHFCDVITPIFDEFFTINREKKIGEFLYSIFSFYSAYSASSIKTRLKLRGEGGGVLHILSWEKAEISFVRVSTHEDIKD